MSTVFVCLPGQCWLVRQLICPQILVSNHRSLETGEDIRAVKELVGSDSCLKFNSCMGLVKEGKVEGKGHAPALFPSEEPGEVLV